MAIYEELTNCNLETKIIGGDNLKAIIDNTFLLNTVGKVMYQLDH